MLVLSRHRDEQIVINNDIVVTVVEIRGDKVRLGIEAAKDIPVHRREVHDIIQRRLAEQAARQQIAANQQADQMQQEQQEQQEQ